MYNLYVVILPLSRERGDVTSDVTMASSRQSVSTSASVTDHAVAATVIYRCTSLL